MSGNAPTLVRYREVELGEGDAIVIRAHTRYGFTCGPEGMDFLTVRSGEASTSLSE